MSLPDWIFGFCDPSAAVDLHQRPFLVATADGLRVCATNGVMLVATAAVGCTAEPLPGGHNVSIPRWLLPPPRVVTVDRDALLGATGPYRALAPCGSCGGVAVGCRLYQDDPGGPPCDGSANPPQRPGRIGGHLFNGNLVARIASVATGRLQVAVVTGTGGVMLRAAWREDGRACYALLMSLDPAAFPGEHPNLLVAPCAPEVRSVSDAALRRAGARH